MDYPGYLGSQPSKSRFVRSIFGVGIFSESHKNQDLKRKKSKKSTKVRCFKPGGGSHSMPQSLFFSSSFRCWGPRKLKQMPLFRGLALWFIGNSILRIFNLCFEKMHSTAAYCSQDAEFSGESLSKKTTKKHLKPFFGSSSRPLSLPNDLSKKMT